KPLHGGLADTVVDHLGGDVQRGFTGDELDTSPATLAHAPGIVPGEANGAEDVDLEELVPQRVVDLEELLRAVDAEIVDQDVRLRLGCRQDFTAAGRPDIGNHTGGIAAAGRFA